MKSLRCQRTTPDDVLTSLSLLVPYLSQSTTPRIAIGQTPAMKYARRLVFVRAKGENSDMWVMSPRWRERLKLVGIDPLTFTVTDQGRWALAWNQIATQKTFHIAQQRVDINLGRIAPYPQPIERHWIQPSKVPRVSKPNVVKDNDTSESDVASPESPYTTMMRRNIRRTIISKGGIY